MNTTPRQRHAVKRPASKHSATARSGFVLLVLSGLTLSGLGLPVTAAARSISTPSGKSAPRAKRATDPLSALGTSEKKVVAGVDRAVPGALELIERTVNVNSGTMNFDGVREVGRMFEKEFADLGFTTEWVDGAGFGRAGHLLARRAPGEKAGGIEKPVAQPGRGRPGVRGLTPGGESSPSAASPKLPRVLLIGHLDTVFEKDSPFQRYQRLSDSTAKGPGVCDMKGGITVMLVALRALSDAGMLDRLAVRVYLGGDEEKSGQPHAQSRRHLREAAEWADVAIGFEDGAGDPRYAVAARRGASGWQLQVTAKPYHSGQIFREDVGSGAVFEAARILEAFRDSLAGERYLTFNPGVILGGTAVRYDSLANRGTAFGKTNVIAESTMVAGDLRAISAEQRDAARATMRRIAAASLPHARAVLTFDDGYPPLAPSDGNRRLLALYDRASRDLGYGGVEAVDPSRAGAADVSFCDGLVDMAMDGVGLMGDGGHTVDEIADLRTLPSQAKRMALTLLRLAEGWGKN